MAFFKDWFLKTNGPNKYRSWVLKAHKSRAERRWRYTSAILLRTHSTDATAPILKLVVSALEKIQLLSGTSCLEPAFVNTIHCWLLYSWAACSSSCIGFDYRLGNQLSHKTRCIPPCQLPHHHQAHLHQCQCYQHSQHFASLIWKKVLITIS